VKPALLLLALACASCWGCTAVNQYRTQRDVNEMRQMVSASLAARSVSQLPTDGGGESSPVSAATGAVSVGRIKASASAPAVTAAGFRAITDLRAGTAGAGVTVGFRMPLYHDKCPLSGVPDTTSLLPTGHHRWDVGYSTKSQYCRTPGVVCDATNMAAWLPGAQIVVFRSGYATPGEQVTVDSLYVSSFSWPFALWGRAWSSVPGRWVLITERASN